MVFLRGSSTHAAGRLDQVTEPGAWPVQGSVPSGVDRRAIGAGGADALGVEVSLGGP